MVLSANSSPLAVGDAAFPTTQWSLVISAGGGSTEAARGALESLCRQYWYPIYYFARRRGLPHHQAEDVTQQFLARLLATDRIGTARPARGKFRTFLLTAFRNFLTDEWRQAQTAKRGGGQVAVSIDLSRAEQRFAAEPADQSLTPDQAFDRAWAVEMLERAVGRLRDEYESSGRGPLFAALAPRLWNPSGAATADQPPGRAEMNAHAVSMALNRLRHRFGLRLRDEVAATVAEGTDIDAELRLIIAALRAT